MNIRESGTFVTHKHSSIREYHEKKFQTCKCLHEGSAIADFRKRSNASEPTNAHSSEHANAHTSKRVSEQTSEHAKLQMYAQASA